MNAATLLEVQAKLCALADGLELIHAAAVADRDHAGRENRGGVCWALEAACRDLEAARLALDDVDGQPAELGAMHPERRAEP